MTITIYTAPISVEVRRRSHLEVQDIKDMVARDNARAGLDKIETVDYCLLDGFTQLKRLCLRFLAEEIKESSDNAGNIPQSYEFEFVMGERRAVGKADPLAAAMHGFVVQHALAYFYETVNQKEMAATHTALERGFADQIEELLYYKQPPRV